MKSRLIKHNIAAFLKGVAAVVTALVLVVLCVFFMKWVVPIAYGHPKISMPICIVSLILIFGWMTAGFAGWYKKY
jgi:hypothetical protein